MTKPRYDLKKENIHAATDADKCEEMGRRYGWELKRVEPKNNPILEVDCVFFGEQTSFEDDRYE
jgi:hypothetical protein